MQTSILIAVSYSSPLSDLFYIATPSAKAAEIFPATDLPCLPCLPLCPSKCFHCLQSECLLPPLVPQFHLTAIYNCTPIIHPIREGCQNFFCEGSPLLPPPVQALLPPSTGPTSIAFAAPVCHCCQYEITPGTVGH